ncbi:MAG: hypothetical protein VX663_06710 [Pseudomonadota bacterium]|nr:hypothetical protein [Pseudomonadota bacterium]
MAAVLLCGHRLALHWQTTAVDSPAELGSPPPAEILRVLTLDNRVLASRLAMVYLQSFELRPGGNWHIADLDYGRVVEWLELAQRLDPRSRYPTLVAASVYAPVGTLEQARVMMEFVESIFLRDPSNRWDALARVALLARYRFGNLPIALEYATSLAEHTAPGMAPPWARQLPLFLLRDMGEQQAALALLEALILEGALSDPAEIRFLLERIGVPDTSEAFSRPEGYEPEVLKDARAVPIKPQ